MFELGDKFGMESLFDWTKKNENGLSSDSLLDSSVLLPVCIDPEMPEKGLYFIGSRTITSSFGKEIDQKGSDALRWLFAKGHTNYPGGYLNQPYDKLGRLNWLKYSRARNIPGLFQNKVIAKMDVPGAQFDDGYYIVGIEDDANASDSVHFRFWYIDCAQKIKVPPHKRIPGNGIDIQSTFPDGNGFETIWTRQLEGDVPIVDGTLPGWGTSPDGSVISYIKYGLDVFQRLMSVTSIIKSSKKPIKKRTINYELDRSATQFVFENGKLDWQNILDKETDSTKNPSKYNWQVYRGSMEEVEVPLGKAYFKLTYNVTEIWETTDGTTVSIKVSPTTFEGTCDSVVARVNYRTDTDPQGVHRTTFYQYTIDFKLKGLMREDLEFDVYRYGDAAQKYLLEDLFKP